MTEMKSKRSENRSTRIHVNASKELAMSRSEIRYKSEISNRLEFTSSLMSMCPKRKNAIKKGYKKKRYKKNAIRNNAIRKNAIKYWFYKSVFQEKKLKFICFHFKTPIKQMLVFFEQGWVKV